MIASVHMFLNGGRYLICLLDGSRCEETLLWPTNSRQRTVCLSLSIICLQVHVKKHLLLKEKTGITTEQM